MTIDRPTSTVRSAASSATAAAHELPGGPVAHEMQDPARDLRSMLDRPIQVRAPRPASLPREPARRRSAGRLCGTHESILTLQPGRAHSYLAAIEQGGKRG